MVFADLKNDFVFRRVFAGHPDLLRALLNDLLDRRGDRAIEGVEYLPTEQPSLARGAKLAILRGRCRERAGATFVVEIQLLHLAGFGDRVAHEAYEARARHHDPDHASTSRIDVVAISICDFVLWPDAAQEAAGLPRVPMKSQWNMSERGSGHPGLLQVQYTFLELPKVPARRPETPGADLWGWLLVHAPELREIPPDLPSLPYRRALELADEATFTRAERDACRRVMDEIQQAREHGEAQRAEGRAAGFATGLAQGIAAAILEILTARGLAANDEVKARIEACTDVATLDRWLARATTAGAALEVVAEAAAG